MLTPDEIIAKMAAETPDLKATLDDAFAKRQAATDAKNNQIKVAADGQKSLDDLQAKIDADNTAALQAANDTDKAASVAEALREAETNYFFSIILGDPKTDPT